MKVLKEYSQFQIFYHTFAADFPDDVLKPHEQHIERIVEGFDVGKDGLPYQLQVSLSKN